MTKSRSAGKGFSPPSDRWAESAVVIIPSPSG